MARGPPHVRMPRNISHPKTRPVTTSSYIQNITEFKKSTSGRVASKHQLFPDRPCCRGAKRAWQAKASSVAD